MQQIMNAPVGTIVSPKKLGRKGTNRLILLPCLKCGKQRWVPISKIEKDKLPLCIVCSCKINGVKGNPKYDWSDLEELYIKQGLSTTEIAAQKGGQCSPSIVLNALESRGITIRSRADAQNLVISSGKKITHSKENHVGWSGGRKKHSAGYILVYAPDHFNPTKTGWIREHRLIWEQVHNQPLPKGWIVHHLNDVKDDNRPENLYGCSKEKHGALAEEHKQRIRALEAKIKLLEKTLDDSQLMFRFGDR